MRAIIKVRCFFSLILFILCVTELHGASTVTDEGALMGVWVFDTKKTALQLKSPPAVIARYFEMYGNSFDIVEYTKDKYFTVLLSSEGEKVIQGSAFYRIVELREGSILIDQFENGGEVEIFFNSLNEFYVNLSYEGFFYKAYYKRLEKK